MGRGITAMTGIPTTGKLYRHRNVASGQRTFRIGEKDCGEGEFVLVLDLWPWSSNPDVLLLTSQGHQKFVTFSRSFQVVPDRVGWHHWWEEVSE